jgi:hypothetical protein
LFFICDLQNNLYIYGVFIMTDVCLQVPSLPFPQAARQQQADVGGGERQVQQGDGHRHPPRCAIHGNETFIRRGTPLADLANLFPAREP